MIINVYRSAGKVPVIIIIIVIIIVPYLWNFNFLDRFFETPSNVKFHIAVEKQRAVHIVTDPSITTQRFPSSRHCSRG
jgi:hypothetical protein